MALFTAFLFFLLACTASAGSCAKKSCGDAFVTTSWNPERIYETVNGKRVSRDIYYYEVITNGCGSEFTDLLLTIPTVCTACSTLTCYNSAWQVIQCPSGASWTEYNALFNGLGVKNTSGHQWHFSARTALRWSFTVDSATSYSKRGKLYIKGPSWAECSVYVPVCDCGCPPCPTKCYKPNPNTCGCNNCTDCLNGQYETAPCNATQNRVCTNCTVCRNGQYQKAPCNATSDRTCQNCTTCRNGEYVKAPCNATSDTTCKSCTVCTMGQYVKAPCNATSDTTCRNCSVCLNGQYRQASCNATSDTTCKNCSVCLNGQYRRAPCNATSDTTCSDCSVCLAGQYRKAPCNATSDTTCSNCTVCRNGQYQTAACNATSDTTCSSCTNCTDGYITVTPCNATHNAVCQPCTNCTNGYFQVVPCNSTFDTVCQSCKNCSANEQVQYPCNATHDTVCIPCPECANCTDPNSHLTNNGLNCSCNEGYATNTESGLCEAVPCCADCQSCGFNASAACFNHDPSVCDYFTCFSEVTPCEATSNFDAGYNIEFIGVSNDDTCCTTPPCSCFTYQLAAALYPLSDFFIGVQCDELQFCSDVTPAPCFEGVTRFDPTINDPPTPTAFFFQDDPLTGLPGITVSGLDSQSANGLNFIFQGNVTVGPLPIIYSAKGTDGAGRRACVVSSDDGPNCLTCP